MGLTKQGYIRGLKLDRNDRDSVRLGIDKIMTRTTPTIPHTQLQVNYVSVLHQVASGTMEPLPNRFVVGQCQRGHLIFAKCRIGLSVL